MSGSEVLGGIVRVQTEASEVGVAQTVVAEAAACGRVEMRGHERRPSTAQTANGGLAGDLARTDAIGP